MVVYNVGDMKRRGSPAIKHGSSDSVTETGAQQGKSSSTATIRRTEGNGQEKSSGRARDTAARRRMSAEERKNTPPMLGDADTVFADGNTMAAYAEANGNIRRNNIEYADNAARNAAQKALHDRMVNEGKILDLTENRENVSQYFPDLRSMPKAERTGLLREKIQTLKNDLRTYLNQLKGVNFEFEINGNTIEATVYNAGIKEVLQNLTQDKAGMLSASEEIFRNAEYLYSTQDKTGNSTVTGWDYFYVPIKLGGDVVGVRIAVRNTVKPREAQIYNWGIKKGDTSLDGVGHLPKGSNSADVSSDASHNSTIRSSTANSQEKSSGKASVEAENRGSDNGNAASDNGKREPKYTVIDGGDTAGKESALAEAYDKAVKQGKGVEISEADLKKYQDIRDDPEQTLIEAVKKYYEESLKGTSVEVTANDGVIEIRFENDGKKKSVGWRMKADKAATFEKLHQLTENAEYAYSEVNRNENERTSIPMFHYFVNNARIAGRDIPVKIQVRDVITRANSKETRYYTHTLEKNMRGNSGPVADTQGANIDSNAIAPSETNIRSTAGNSQEKSFGKASVEVENWNTKTNEEDARRDFSPAGEPPRVDLAADSFCSITHALMPQKLRLRRNRSAFFCPRQRQTAFPSVQIPSRKAYTKKDSLPHRAGNLFWYARRDLNPRPLAPEANTLSS